MGIENYTLANLRRKIIAMYGKDVEPAAFGNIALEIIMKRNMIYKDLERDPTPEKKTECERSVSELEDLEKILISLYSLNRITSRKQPFGLTRFREHDYHLFDKKVLL